jgi:hypothetical protein
MNRNESGNKTYQNNAILVKKLPINLQYTFLFPQLFLHVVSFSARVSTVYAISLTIMFQGFLFLSVTKARSLVIKCHLIFQHQHFYSQ